MTDNRQTHVLFHHRKNTMEDVEGDGSCFFRAVLRYCMVNAFGELYYILKEAFHVDPVSLNDEGRTVQAMRNFLRDLILNNQDKGVIDGMFDYIKSLYVLRESERQDRARVRKKGRSTITQVLEAGPSWFKEVAQHVFNAGSHYVKDPDRETFRHKCAWRMSQMNSWAGELEVELVSQIFRNQGIQVDILMDINPALNDAHKIMIETTPFRPNRIVLINIDGLHYNYIWFGLESYKDWFQKRYKYHHYQKKAHHVHSNIQSMSTGARTGARRKNKDGKHVYTNIS